MDVLLLAIAFFVGTVLFFFLLGRFTWGTGADVVDWDPSGRAEAKRMTESEDMAHQLEMINRRRRAQKLPEVSEDTVLRRLSEDDKPD